MPVWWPSLRSGKVRRHCATHEAIEKRDRECRVAMRRTIQHPLGNQAVTRGRDAGNFHPHLFGDVAGSVRSLSHRRHGLEVALLGGREPVKADTEEAGVKFRKCTARGRGNVFGGYGGGVGRVPAMLAPLLEEIGVALGLLDYGIEGGPIDRLVFPLDRQANGFARGIGIERPDGDKFEKALGVRLCAAHLPKELWQARRHHGDRQLLLIGLMQGADQRRQLLFGHVLQFVDEQDDSGSAFACRFADRHNDIGQIGVEIAAIRQPGLRGNIDRDLEVIVFDLELGEAGERSQRARDAFRCLLHAIKTQ